MSVTPLLKFAITPQISVGGGVRITELDPLPDVPGLEGQMANAAIGYAASGLDSAPDTYANVARIAHDAIAAFAVDVRAGRQIKGGIAVPPKAEPGARG